MGFKCDWFTLEKRVKLEERSRDLAEENLKKEITNCLKLLEVRLITFGDYTFGCIINKVFKIT